MNENQDQSSGEDNDDKCGGHVTARAATILDCGPGRRDGDANRSMVLLTMGNSKGTIDQVAIENADGKRLLRLLQHVLYGQTEGLEGQAAPSNEASVSHPGRRTARKRTLKAICEIGLRM